MNVSGELIPHLLYLQEGTPVSIQ